MKIAISGSMQFADTMLAAHDELRELGHEALVPESYELYRGKSADEQERLKLDQKYNHDAMREFWRLMQRADALLVVNFEKRSVPNYIGGNAFLEMGFAHVLNQQIFLYNPVPNLPYRTEIEAMKPIVLNGDLVKIQAYAAHSRTH